jgi:ketosteroid isomerase-like protein
VSERNVELHRRALKAFNARDTEAFIACFDPSIEFHSTFAAVESAVYHGQNELRRYFRDLADAWEEIRGEPEAYFDLGEHTLAFHVMHGRGRHSGVEVGMPIAQVVRWREGVIVYFKAYADREEALRDLGVSEDELERIAP